MVVVCQAIRNCNMHENGPCFQKFVLFISWCKHNVGKKTGHGNAALDRRKD